MTWLAKEHGFGQPQKDLLTHSVGQKPMMVSLITDYWVAEIKTVLLYLLRIILGYGTMLFVEIVIISFVKFIVDKNVSV